ncbi:hypothetical protein SS1G_06261 [Sclerotinia sclerotiorum 1980 UF-70]|uniref:Uncharacterized protein n=1 Tax=Sclerotinia sclerotiorum (strain ATCC 18683 / 1980 / Ss-1) TaxID=665079 RepID=A7ELR4_SCLS1|nr:hypothetical protein SS1G_06261 [Sclerotinia sclerotiorum 1980 UF-70]EDO03780.1 hypothetical protein SS1G_06261 [Sclerotinia sclerotiorum 1980 UF-70]
MAFYDSSSDQDVADGFPIILEPDDDSLFDMRGDDTRLNNDTMKEVHQVKEIKKVKEVPKNAMVPKHPINSMQGAFAESMEEASDTTRTAPKIGDAATRRKILIEQDVSEDTHSLRWQRQPDQKYHELWKLMAQISFGIYLLLNGIARDEEQVMSILQGHVNEVDGFLEMTLEDFDLAQSDIEERLKHLKLPLQNITIFDAMLEDRAFRSQIVSGNERIEHVITRTAAAMKDTLLDAQQGMDACKEFTIYLAGQKDNMTWRQQRPNMERVFDAMCGNVEGWHKAYVSLQTKGHHLGVALVQLGTIVAEMDRRAGRVSRESRFSVSSPVQAQSPPISRNLRASMIKELPSDPSPITPAISATLPAFSLLRTLVVDPSLHLKPSSVARPRDRSDQRRVEPLDLSADRAERQREKKIREERSRERLREEHRREERKRKGSGGSGGPLSIPRRPELATDTPPSRGVDSAYCSESDPPVAIRSIQETLPSPSFQSTISAVSAPTFSNELEIPAMLSRDFIPSPHSDKQFFRPVNASPHSPLQRPWTAAPVHHHERVPSSLSRSVAPSRMGMSVMSDMTTVTMEDGKKVKKKRSAFGWLKKAFSLSEEERAEYEERKRRQDPDPYYERRPPRQFLDGKRLPQPQPDYRERA